MGPPARNLPSASRKKDTKDSTSGDGVDVLAAVRQLQEQLQQALADKEQQANEWKAERKALEDSLNHAHGEIDDLKAKYTAQHQQNVELSKQVATLTRDVATALRSRPAMPQAPGLPPAMSNVLVAHCPGDKPLSEVVDACASVAGCPTSGVHVALMKRASDKTPTGDPAQPATSSPPASASEAVKRNLNVTYKVTYVTPESASEALRNKATRMKGSNVYIGQWLSKEQQAVRKQYGPIEARLRREGVKALDWHNGVLMRKNLMSGKWEAVPLPDQA